MTEKEIEEILEKVGLDPNDKRKYRKYSLGMKKKTKTWHSVRIYGKQI